ncbi:GyrI-like domain-containing protein [Microbacterium terricola]|uniref:AraC effector-binding domain-containing protein n=1 Tax=Microbacterium terricola TaxID=344163 RepID=A0ABM8E1R2_9MICO|nr:GyrI-like domain-containing protein [Microbacterium terricola]UYK40548.1 GyrI-like domain-containing protein [Microbacterium terricola]BDV31726.1 hypothetical protein Microterr_23860 [Microbacterium terricola]
MSEVEYKSIEPVTVYAASGTAQGPGPDYVPPVIDEILPPLLTALQSAGVDFEEPGIFWYEPTGAGDELRVWVSWVAGGGEAVSGDGWEVVDLPAVSRAATLTHHGEMAGIGSAWQHLMQTVAADGGEIAGPSREVYLVSGPMSQSEWVTELQLPVSP